MFMDWTKRGWHKMMNEKIKTKFKWQEFYRGKVRGKLLPQQQKKSEEIKTDGRCPLSLAQTLHTPNIPSFVIRRGKKWYNKKL